MYSQAGKHHQNDPKVGELPCFSNQAGQAVVDVGVLIQKLHKVVKIVDKNFCCSRKTAKPIILLSKKDTGYIPLLQKVNEFFVSIPGLV